jgi:BirA family transcriptional regulator, biotin operon repressor / biotin---[acetyl-CoA-carboxylase] ligase
VAVSESSFERFRRMMDEMSFETLPLFSKPQFSWNLRTEYVGRRFQYRPYSESTQDDARQVLTRWGAASGTILLAELQTSGRGRAGRRWVSPPDVNLHFTLTVHPVDDLHPLAYVTPLAIAEAIEEIAARSGDEPRVDLKWPNDAQIGGKKVAGVLIETATTQDGEDVALIGVGLNVNIDVGAYPEIAGIATSIKETLGHEVPREELLALFCNHFEALWEQAKAGDSSAAFEAWKSRLVTLGAEVTATGSEVLQGRAVDVLRDGTLVIETAHGERVSVEAGDVTLSPSPFST